MYNVIGTHKKSIEKAYNYRWARIFRRLFNKGAFLDQKVVLNLWYDYTRPNSQKLFPSI